MWHGSELSDLLHVAFFWCLASYSVLIQTIQFRISIVFVYTQLNVQTALFQTIQFSISMQFSSI